ncbi:MAG: glycosyltransferase [Caldilineaceae bacterium]|nr:glycosyltransferase [Caldilineaceae bacterium]
MDALRRPALEPRQYSRGGNGPDDWLGHTRVALVHDWLNQMGGAENVLEEFAALFQGAPIYTSMYGPDKMPDAYRNWPIHTTFMQRLPRVTENHQLYLPLYPAAFQTTDLSDFDLILSNKSGFCHGVRARKGNQKALHICYCLTPTRFLWLYDQYRQRENIGGLLDFGLKPLLAMLRRWDYAAAQRVDYFIAISSTVQERIREIYGRESAIVHPPVNTLQFTPDHAVPVGDYYLIVSRLIPYKRIDLAVNAFQALPQERLLVVGSGRARQSLEAQAGSNVSFLGWQSPERQLELMRGCKAFLFPGLEDFGIAPVEAMSAGRPVIAYQGGGALDTVLQGKTGEFFDEQTPDSLCQAIQQFDPHAYDPVDCRAQAETFSQEEFRRRLLDRIEQYVSQGTA